MTTTGTKRTTTSHTGSALPTSGRVTAVKASTTATVPRTATARSTRTSPTRLLDRRTPVARMAAMNAAALMKCAAKDWP